MTEAVVSHDLMGGKLHVYKRPGSRFWQCSAYEASKSRRISTHEESLAQAKQVAEDWYLELRGKLRSGELKAERTFRDAARDSSANTRSSPKASAILNMSRTINVG